MTVEPVPETSNPRLSFAALRQGFARYMPLGGIVAGVLAVEMVIVSSAVATEGAAKLNDHPMARGASAVASVTNAEAIGRVLYTNYIYFFQAAGMVLLVAMIGAIVLTLRHRPGVKKQNVAAQVGRTRATGMQVVSLKAGEGIPE